MFKTLYKWVKLLFLLFWLFAMIIIGMWMFFENSQEVSVSYLGYEVANQALGFVICQMLFVGGFLGYLTSVVTFKSREVWYKRRYKKSQKTLEKLKHVETQG